jgi:hypothetical protein
VQYALTHPLTHLCCSNNILLLALRSKPPHLVKIDLTLLHPQPLPRPHRQAHPRLPLHQRSLLLLPALADGPLLKNQARQTARQAKRRPARGRRVVPRRLRQHLFDSVLLEGGPGRHLGRPGPRDVPRRRARVVPAVRALPPRPLREPDPRHARAAGRARTEVLHVAGEGGREQEEDGGCGDDGDADTAVYRVVTCRSIWGHFRSAGFGLQGRNTK